MEQNEISKSNKTKLFVLTMLILLVSVAGISYAYFTINIVGNEEASSMRVKTANLSLVYNDVQIISDEYIEPGWTDTKVLTVYNDGNVDAPFIIKFRELTNTIINGELVLSATCTTPNGVCDNLPERAVHSASTEITDAYMYGPITIPVGATYTYTLRVKFKETGSNQNYNQNKSFIGTLNIGDGTATADNCFTTTGTTTLTISSYTCSATDVIIPSTINGKTITEIGSNVFNNKGLTSVVIPDTITAIGNQAFPQNQLTSIVIPNSVTSIGELAFAMDQLTSVVIPNSVTSIGDAAFDYNNLISAVISSGVTSIGMMSFYHNQLTSLIIPSSVTTIGRTSFGSNQLTSVTIPSSITTIEASAFSSNQLASVTIPDSVTTIGDNAFYGNQLTSVTIPSSVTSIGSYAFYNNSLTSVTIPSSVMSIGSYAFSCYNAADKKLTSVRIEGKTSSSGFTSYGSDIWGWASGLTCTTDNTSYNANGCIIWDKPNVPPLPGL